MKVERRIILVSYKLMKEVLMDIFERLYEIYDKASYDILKSRLSRTSLNHLTINHYEYLDRIYQLDAPTLSQLADDMTLSKPSVTVMVNKLIKEGLVEKKQDDEDKRVFHVKLTTLGYEVLTIERDTFMMMTTKILKNLNPSEQASLKALLEKAIE